jgi:hypothetical protein
MKVVLNFFIVLIFLGTISFSYSQSMKKIYKNEVEAGLNRTNSIKPGTIEEIDLQHLPPIVKKYLTNASVIGKEKVVNVRTKFVGKIRSKPNDGWMTFSSEQYNFFDQPTRIFYIKAHKMGIPATGIHLYKNETAIMVIKIAGLFKVVDAKGIEMNQGETVTVFNDMCFMAPASLIDKNIKWELIDSLTVKARYTNGSISISAKLYFNEQGELINFVSNDRFESADGKIYKNYPWSTPIKEYKDFKGIKIASSASIIFHRPDTDFCYGEFILKEIEYNCKELK